MGHGRDRHPGTYEVGGSRNDGVNGVVDGLDPTLIGTFGSRAAFAGYDPGGIKSSTALWISDGTASGTYQVGGALNASVNGAVAADGLNPRAFGSLGARLLFTGKDQSGKWGLWVTDGTAAGTTEIGGLNNAGVAGAYAGGLDPTSFVVEGGEAYFVAENSNDQKVVFVSNGSLAGTYELGGSAAPTNAALSTATRPCRRRGRRRSEARLAAKAWTRDLQALDLRPRRFAWTGRKGPPRNGPILQTVRPRL